DHADWSPLQRAQPPELRGSPADLPLPERIAEDHFHRAAPLPLVVSKQPAVSRRDADEPVERRRRAKAGESLRAVLVAERHRLLAVERDFVEPRNGGHSVEISWNPCSPPRRPRAWITVLEPRDC